MYFLSSIPRSGSTLLSALLNQRNDTYVSPTSGLCDTLGAAITTWGSNPATHAAGGVEEDGINILKSITNSYYSKRSESIIIDKSRGWPHPNIMKTMKKVQGEIKIIATVRPIRECLASFIKIAKPDNIRDFCKNSELAAHLFSSYQALKLGYEANPDNFLIIEYDDLVDNPQSQLDRVADFLSIPRQKCDPNNINPVKENDKIWGIKNLHKVRKKIKALSYDPKKILGDDLWNFYQGGNFWRTELHEEKKPQLLDLQLEAGLRGDFDKGWEIAQQLPETDDRAAFNKGWYLLRQGKLQEGHKLLDRGRNIDVFGNSHIRSKQPIWNGQKGVVLLNLEGGLGDQIHGVRFAKDISKIGCKVVVSCSGELAPILIDVKGISAVIQHEAALGVYHDYWLPSMSSVIPLGYEYKDLDGSPYIKRTVKNKKKIGIRWQGNPKFEHEQHRIFPAQLLFDIVEGLNVVSLQRDDGVDLKPKDMPQSDVSTWEATRKSISECDLVITSCTSVAHLSAAMGVETWIIVPILSYYLWALPGEKTLYYDSVTLFRQTEYGDWVEPFKIIKERLQKYIK